MTSHVEGPVPDQLLASAAAVREANAEAAAALVRFAETAAQHLVEQASDVAKRLLVDTADVADAHRVGNNEIMHRIDSIDKKLDRMDQMVITGNGQPSLISRVTVLETAQGRITIASVITGIGMVGTFVLTYLHK